MSISRARRVALAAVLSVAAVGSAVPAAQADAVDCDTRLERLEAQFYEMADRRGYEAASEWWQARWHAYYQSCVLP